MILLKPNRILNFSTVESAIIIIFWLIYALRVRKKIAKKYIRRRFVVIKWTRVWLQICMLFSNPFIYLINLLQNIHPNFEIGIPMTNFKFAQLNFKWMRTFMYLYSNLPNSLWFLQFACFIGKVFIRDFTLMNLILFLYKYIQKT